MEYVIQFRIELLGVDPAVWRRIQVPEDYTLWDLHVAIQDSMGWLDYHLHAFRVVGSEVTYGIPDEDDDAPFNTKPGWKAKVQDVFSYSDSVGTYEYDFGDGWIHLLVLEGFEPRQEAIQYPRCVAGARRCPPEDCGGPHGYKELLMALQDSSHPEHESLLEWVGGPLYPEEFNPNDVSFDDPKKRWTTAFS
jgi:hypothetical protein